MSVRPEGAKNRKQSVMIAYDKVRNYSIDGTKQWQKKLNKIMDSGETQLFLGVLLMLSLFMNESWVLGDAPDSSNDALYGILTFVFLCFSAESIILSFVQPNYFLSFFFWMDVMGTLSIILDIGWFADNIFGQGSGNSGSILRATRAAKLGARYGRLMRILKLMKFIHLLPCFKQDEVEKPEPTLNAVRRVSNQLSTVLSQRVAGLVMLMVIVMPFLSYSAPFTDNSISAWQRSFKLLAKDGSTSSALMLEMVDKFEKFYIRKDNHLISLLIESPTSGLNINKKYQNIDTIRKANVLLYKTDYTVSNVSYDVNITIDKAIENKEDALYGILTILLVIVCLVFFSASFQNAVDSLMVVPLEKIMTSLRTSAAIMLKSMKVMEEEEEGDEDEDGELETELLERMVEKLVKIVGHMAGEKSLDILEDKNVDAATANWLNDTYNTGNKQITQISGSVEEAKTQKRIMSLSDVSLPVSIENVNSWDFDTLDLDGDQLSDVFIYLLSATNVFEDFKVPMDVMKKFLVSLSGQYVDNPYHNYKHGYDVAHCVYRLVTLPGLNAILSHLEFFSLLIAAIGHDVGHPGVNNVYLVKAKNELALRHNDRSPLENMHCSVIYDTLSKPETNIFVGLTDSQWREARKVVLGTVLGTDMSHHFEQISKTQLFHEVNGEDVGQFCSGEKDIIECLSEEKERMFIMEICLHCADISNPYKPFKICSKWAELIVEEFSRQGEREASEGLEISPMMDRKTIQLCNMQMGFIEFVVAPLIIAFINIFQPLHELGTNMADNYCCWGNKRILEIKIDDSITNKDEEISKLEDRMNKFKGRLSFCQDYAKKPRRGSAHINLLDQIPNFNTKNK
jgi:hypothetical protein